MGNLTQGGMSAAGMAGQSQSWGLLSGGLNAVGALASGIGQGQQYDYQAQVAQNNAAITRSNLDASLQAYSYEESVSKMQTASKVAGQLAAQSANGVDVGVGSPVAVRNSTQELGALDAAMIHYNGMRAAMGLGNEATNYDAMAEYDKKAAANARLGGVAKMAASLISSASALSGRASDYGLAFSGSGGMTVPKGSLAGASDLNFGNYG